MVMSVRVQEHDITPVETNIATLGGAICKAAKEVVSEECETNILVMPSEVNPAPSPVTVGSRRGSKKKTEEERDEFWSQRPFWLTEGWTMNVKVGKGGATAGIRDRYYYEPRTSHQFRLRKEVEKFLQTGEVPRYKPKPKTKESNVVHTNSEPTPSSHMVWPPTLEFYSKHLPSFMSGGRSNQQSEVGTTIIGQYEAEETVGIKQPVPSNTDGLETIFNIEREEGT